MSFHKKDGSINQILSRLNTAPALSGVRELNKEEVARVVDRAQRQSARYVVISYLSSVNLI